MGDRVPADARGRNAPAQLKGLTDMRSMTGFGAGSVPLGGITLNLELRSLNNRYLDVRVRLPPELSEHTFFLEQQCRERLTRGRFDVSARLEGAEAGQTHLNQELCGSIYAQLTQLRDRIAPGADVPFSLLGAFPAALGATLAFAPDSSKKALVEALTLALTQLNQMRATEGGNLKDELQTRLNRAGRLMEELAAVAPRLSEANEGRLRQRLQKLASHVGAAHDDRLFAELAILADRSDITEEIVRFQSHCAQFEGMLNASEPCGRKLDFLLQEMSREVNTVGAKCHDADASARVVELKAELERLREQVQNVE